MYHSLIGYSFSLSSLQQIQTRGIRKRMYASHNKSKTKYRGDNFLYEKNAKRHEVEGKEFNEKDYFDTMLKCGYVVDKMNNDLLYGIHPVLAALKNQSRDIKQLFVKYKDGRYRQGIEDILDLYEEQYKKEPVYLEGDMLDRLVGGDTNHQGVVLETNKVFPAYKNWLSEEDDPNAIYLLLDRISDPQNLGAIIRSASFFGVKGVILSEKHTSPLSPVVSKISSGAMESMPIFQVTNLNMFIEESRTNNWEIVATASEADLETEAKMINSYSLRRNGPTLLIMGAEGKGVKQSLLLNSDKIVSIELLHNNSPTLDSLNVRWKNIFF
eukprot:TRINITY_DN4647_c0_g1_i1.p1 TRINITY_DN4647_c0_g1~~TRINITY_DN4647_c0_g1_i1.p1  ORF type:complete len:326 (+),score=74.01 TRINITY_DN4647_c0_g1_i1:173-1150(+)